MKKFFIYLILSSFTLHVFAQIQKGDFLISANGSYYKAYTSSGGITNNLNTEGKNLDLGVSIGYFVSKNLIIGLGLDYNWIKEKSSNLLYIKQNYLQIEGYENKGNGFFPNVYLGYYLKIIDKLYFSANIKFGYGSFKTEWSSTIVSENLAALDTMDPIDSDLINVSTNSQNDEYDLFNASLSPELSYFILNNVALYAGLGDVRYSAVDGLDDGKWSAYFNHNFWKFGIKIKL